MKSDLLEEICLEIGKLVLKVMATQRSYSCPECNLASVRVHSQYQRKLADLPCVGIPVCVLWTVGYLGCVGGYAAYTPPNLEIITVNPNDPVLLRLGMR